MKLITRDIDYAVRALCLMSGTKNGEIVSVAELVKKLKTPRPFLRKILQLLNKNGVLKSYKGNGGGFKLALPPQKIFLGNLVEIFQGPVQLNQCIFKKKICPSISTCIFRQKIGAIETYVVSQLKSISIDSLLAKEDFYG